MLTSLILTVTSPDKPGVVEAVAKILADNRGNWLESHFAQLAGRFAGIVRVQVDADATEALRDAFAALSRQRISVSVDEDIEAAAPPTKVIKASFHALGPDRPGIVREISQAFVEYSINIEEIATRLSSMPYSGEPLFEAEGVLSIPAELNIDEIDDRLDSIADQLGVDISLQTADKQ